jgi:hypothetical protein
MTKRDLLSLALKILGVLSAMGAVASLPAIGLAINMVHEGRQHDINPTVVLAGAILSPALYAAMAWVLLKGGDAIARKLMPEDSAITAVGAPDWEKPIFVLSLRITGVVCLAMGIPALGEFLLYLGMLWRYHQGVIGFQSLAHLSNALLLFAVGAYLLSGGKHLVAFVFRQK